MHDAYQRALNTLAKWVDSNENPTKQQRLFDLPFMFVHPFFILENPV
jgi:hypothetical protein